ncbi:hypothetical protein JHK87_050366 [Glycine soja]|nr:hypothetical protein JHK87_050366 [Glycine soja]
MLPRSSYLQVCLKIVLSTPRRVLACISVTPPCPPSKEGSIHCCASVFSASRVSLLRKLQSPFQSFRALQLLLKVAAEANKLLKYNPTIGVEVVNGGTRLALEQKRMQPNPCQWEYKVAEGFKSWLLDTWSACTHKKKVMASTLMAFWNLSSKIEAHNVRGFSSPCACGFYGDHVAEGFKSWLLDTWSACTHKKKVMASALMAFWNLSSIKTRMFTGLILGQKGILNFKEIYFLAGYRQKVIYSVKLVYIIELVVSSLFDIFTCFPSVSSACFICT